MAKREGLIQSLPVKTRALKRRIEQKTVFLIRVEALMEKETDLLFAEAGDFEENYPMPSAFAAYAKYLNIYLKKGGV